MFTRQQYLYPRPSYPGFPKGIGMGTTGLNEPWTKS